MKQIASLKCPVGKVFGKGDINEQKEFLNSRQPRMIIGTPGRLHRMHTEKGISFTTPSGSGSSKSGMLLVIDMKRNEKSFNVLDMPSVNTDFFKLFRETELQSQIIQGRVKVLFAWQ